MREHVACLLAVVVGCGGAGAGGASLPAVTSQGAGSSSAAQPVSAASTAAKSAPGLTGGCTASAEAEALHEAESEQRLIHVVIVVEANATTRTV